MAYETRRAAGRALAAALREYAGTDAVVVGVTRGGVVVADEVAQRLALPLDALVVHKIPLDATAHLHLGVVAEPDHVAINRATLRGLTLPRGWLRDAVQGAVGAVGQRSATCHGARRRHDLRGRRVLLVDDSAATGATLRAAVRAIRARAPRAIVVAVPVAPRPVRAALGRDVERVICLDTPADLIWQGVHYPPGGEISDDAIRQLLERPERALAAGRRSTRGQRVLRAGAPSRG